ncbi:leucine-rich repeats and immunoglobulin-like domains protein 1 isoform X2 [Cimex lectularius]|nr:leucine-rich repeats and immunoglobulin-like domains protein 1 isoform X2 [Cimex lectularius]
MKIVVLFIILLAKTIKSAENWECPQVRNVSCMCDLPRTLRCTGTNGALPLIARTLRKLKFPNTVSLLDCTIQNLSSIQSPVFQGVSLLGLVLSSGEITTLIDNAFIGLTSPLHALGLPDNKLKTIPIKAIEKLKALTRLDLSYNEIETLSDMSLKGLHSLKFLDLTGNRVTKISPLGFSNLNKLEVLRLKLNNIDIIKMKNINGLVNLKEIDLSNNQLAGPLSDGIFPLFPKLQNLNLGYNQLSSVTKRALAGHSHLETLILKHNLIDVLEDHAFESIPTLKTLDLAHNRIVTVAEASLAHLPNLKSLDVSNNFLRAITPDLVRSLTGLEELKLDDNDISMITNGVLAPLNLKEISLADNPLNCDCNLKDFADWLKKSNVTKESKSSAVCATPPSLENGLVDDLKAQDFICDGNDEFDFDMSNHPVSRSKIIYLGYNFDGTKLSLMWNLNHVLSYTCYALLMYEELGNHEILLESNRLRCNSNTMKDPTNLVVGLDAPHLQIGHRYRYSLVLIEKNLRNETYRLIGRSDVSLLQKNMSQILSLTANVTSPGTIFINTNIWPQNENCFVTLHIMTLSKTLQQMNLNCSFRKLTVKEVEDRGPYKICAVLSNNLGRCVWVNSVSEFHRFLYPSAIMATFLLSLAILALLILAYKKIYRKVRQKITPNMAHDLLYARYTKLLGTTRL